MKENLKSFVITATPRLDKRKSNITGADQSFNPNSRTYYDVEVDDTSQLGFTGLPEDFETELKQSNFNVSQIQAFPEQVLTALSFARKGGFQDQQL